MKTDIKAVLISNKNIFIAVYALLILLAILSWLLGNADFKNYETVLKPYPLYLEHLNDILTMGIGLTQAIIITVFFMNLKNSNPLGPIAFFLALFVTFTLVLFSVFTVL